MVEVFDCDGFDQFGIADSDPGLGYGVAAPSVAVLPGGVHVPLDVVSLVDHERLTAQTQPGLDHRNPHLLQSSVLPPQEHDGEDKAEGE